MKRLALAIALAIVLSACGEHAVPPPPPWVHGRMYAMLRYYDRRACFYREAEQSATVGSAAMRWALRNDAIWSGRYDAEAARLESAGHPTPTEGALFDVVCP